MSAFPPPLEPPPTPPGRRAEATGRTGLGKDAGKHGMMDDDISTEEAGRWKDGLVGVYWSCWYGHAVLGRRCCAWLVIFGHPG